MGYSFRLTARVLLYAPSHRLDNTYHSLWYTSRGALAGTRNSSMGSPCQIARERKTIGCHCMGYYFLLTARDLLYTPSHSHDIPYHSVYCTCCGALTGTRNSSMGPRWIDLMTHCTMGGWFTMVLYLTPIKKKCLFKICTVSWHQSHSVSQWV